MEYENTFFVLYLCILHKEIIKTEERVLSLLFLAYLALK